MKKDKYWIFFFIFCSIFSLTLSSKAYGKSQELTVFKKMMVQFYINNFSFYMVREGTELYTLSEKEVVFKGPLGSQGFAAFRSMEENPLKSQMSARRYILLMKMVMKDSLKGFVYVFQKNGNVYIAKKSKIIKIDFLKFNDSKYLASLDQFANQDVDKHQKSKYGEKISVNDDGDPIEYSEIQKTSSWYSFQIFTAIVNNAYMTMGLAYSPYFKISSIDFEFSPRFYLAPGKSNENETFMSYGLLLILRNYMKKSYLEFGTGIEKIPKLGYSDPILNIGYGYKQKIVVFDSVFIAFNYVTSQTPRYEFILGLEYRY